MAYVFALVLPLLLVAALAFPVVYLIRRPDLALPGRTNPGSATEGGSGVGDPYFPTYGSTGYDAIRYAIAVSFDPSTERLTGTTTITARATQTLASFFYDLALPTHQVVVDGREARFEQRGAFDVKVVPEGRIPVGEEFTVVVTYGGQPAEVATPGGREPWSVTQQEFTVAGEPESSAWWFPANDHPSDPALMDVSIRVPAGWEAISVGRLESRDTAAEDAWDTWHWLSRQPMATYLNFMTIGQYEITEDVVDGRPAVYAVTAQLSPDDRAKAFSALEKTGPIIRRLETFFGPYPFTEVGGVVPAHQLKFGGLENQTRPVYLAGAILDEDYAPSLIAHELSHMWYGNHVTLEQWNDICVNECWASWGDWAYTASVTGESLTDRLNRFYDQYAQNARFWTVPLEDPGPDHLFTVVYVRGPMMVQALRHRMGEDAFFELARTWAASPGSRSLEDWMARAQELTPVDLGPFFQAWVYGTTAPAKTAENGLA
jgi:aminopeptidase N